MIGYDLFNFVVCEGFSVVSFLLCFLGLPGRLLIGAGVGLSYEVGSQYSSPCVGLMKCSYVALYDPIVSHPWQKSSGFLTWCAMHAMACSHGIPNVKNKGRAESFMCQKQNIKQVLFSEQVKISNALRVGKFLYTKWKATIKGSCADLTLKALFSLFSSRQNNYLEQNNWDYEN